MTDRLATAEPAATDPSWEDPVRTPPPSAAPVLAVDDWLLELARSERIDLRRVSILALVEAFAAALQRALASPGRVDLSRWGEFLAMAAQLALLRSRLLLPPESAEAQSAQRDAEALRRQLLEAEFMRRAASWLGARPQLGREVFGRGVDIAEREASGRVADIADLFRACLVALRIPEPTETYALSIPPLWRLPDALARITRLLAERPEGGDFRGFLPRVRRDGPGFELRCRAALASTLVAGLELARGEALSLTQSAPWEPIQLATTVRDVR